MAAARKEFSAGGVIYEKNGPVIKVALIAKKAKTVWCLPKGKIEKGETILGAAAREIKEETGLSGRYIKDLGEIAYRFLSPIDKARVFKKVRFFLFQCQKGPITKHGDPDNEVDEVAWFTVSDALKIMSYPSEKAIMQKAVGFINAEAGV